MKKILIGIGLIVFSLLITFVFFEQMSWYHFGDTPTNVVLVRLIIGFLFVLIVLSGILFLIKRRKK